MTGPAGGGGGGNNDRPTRSECEWFSGPNGLESERCNAQPVWDSVSVSCVEIAVCVCLCERECCSCLRSHHDGIICAGVGMMIVLRTWEFEFYGVG